MVKALENSSATSAHAPARGHQRTASEIDFFMLSNERINRRRPAIPRAWFRWVMWFFSVTNLRDGFRVDQRDPLIKYMTSTTTSTNVAEHRFTYRPSGARLFCQCCT
jgi:hypothetical protein